VSSKSWMSSSYGVSTKLSMSSKLFIRILGCLDSVLPRPTKSSISWNGFKLLPGLSPLRKESSSYSWITSTLSFSPITILRPANVVTFLSENTIFFEDCFRKSLLDLKFSDFWERGEGLLPSDIRGKTLLLLNPVFLFRGVNNALSLFSVPDHITISE